MSSTNGLAWFGECRIQLATALVCQVLLTVSAYAADKQTHPSFAGVWNRSSSITEGFASIDASVYRPEYARRYQATVDAVNEGKLDLGAACLPPGMVRDGELGLFEILEAPKGRLTILYEFMTQIRRIHLDGKFPEYVDPTVGGYSVARWQGDTLVVQTHGISEFAYLDRNAAPHSDQLQVTEKFKLVNADLLQVDYTLDDPQAFLHPVEFSRQFNRLADGELIDYECTENQRNPINEDGSVGFEFGSEP